MQDDHDVDYWTPLVNDFIKKTKTVTVKHKFSSSGVKKINVMARDQWGVTSDWSDPIKVNIEKSKSRTYKNLFQNIFFEETKIFQKIFNELNYFI